METKTLEESSAPTTQEAPDTEQSATETLPMGSASQATAPNSATTAAQQLLINATSIQPQTTGEHAHNFNIFYIQNQKLSKE